MKTLKTLSAALLIFVSFSAFADDESKAEKLNVNYALKTYVDAITHGKINGLADVLDRDVKFTSMRGETIIHHSKSQMLGALKNTENVEQNCTTDYSVVESNPSLTVVKVVMKYEGFSRINYVSLVNTTKGWKITNVSSSFS